MGGSAVREIPLLSMLFYLYHDVASGWPRGRPVLVGSLRLQFGRATWKTSSGGEFGWGGTSVK